MSRSEGEERAPRRRLLELLQEAQATRQTISFWWRDDDAVTATPALDRLLALARGFNVPLGLAVIPKAATAALAERVGDADGVRVLQHGWQHRRHSPEGEKKMELGDHRPIGAVLDELRMGRERLAALVPTRFLPVLVPPWNRVSARVAAQRASAGLIGISTFGRRQSRDPRWVNTQVDIIDWTTRAALPPAQAYALLCRELQRRLKGDGEPIGLLSHHLLHGDASWAFLEDLLALVDGHPAVAWPGLEALFGLHKTPISRSAAGSARP